MSDLIRLTELAAVADDECASAPPLPSADERRAIRLAADVPLVHIAAAVGVSQPTMYRAEMGTQMHSAATERRYRRVLNGIAQRVALRDPDSLAGSTWGLVNHG